MRQRRINWVYVILGIMVTVQLAGIIYYFQFCKRGYHSDEIWSYGYANSYYQKDIYQDQNGNLINMNEWIDAQILKDYIVVNEEEQFRYDSVYQNQINDLSPPFHSMVLHTICSFFPNTFSRWFSFSINIMSFIFCMLFLFKTAKLLKNDLFALCCCGLYGFSMGARDTYIYLRMYAMCTAFVMIIIYNLLRYLQKYKENKKLFQYNLVIICVISLFGFLTNYYMVSFMGIITFFVCAYLLFNKQIKVMFVYGFSMLAIFILSVIIFPSMLQISAGNVQTVGAAMNYNFEIRFRLLLNFIMLKIYSINISIYKTGVLRIVMGYIVFALVVLMPLIVFLRNTQAAQKLKNKICLCFERFKLICRNLLKGTNGIWIYFVFLVSVICQTIVVGETSNVYQMGPWEDRYLFLTYPIVAILGMAFIYQLSDKIIKNRKLGRKIFILISILLVGVNIYNCTQYGEYFFEKGRGKAIEDCVKDRNCMLIRNLPWMLTTMVPVLMDADKLFQVQYGEYENLEAGYREMAQGQEIVVIIDTSFLDSPVEAINYAMSEAGIIGEKDEGQTENQKIYEEMIQFLEGLEPDTNMEVLTKQSIFGRKMEVYLINP